MGRGGPVETAGAVEEFEVEGAGGLPVDRGGHPGGSLPMEQLEEVMVSGKLWKVGDILRQLCDCVE